MNGTGTPIPHDVIAIFIAIKLLFDTELGNHHITIEITDNLAISHNPCTSCIQLMVKTTQLHSSIKPASHSTHAKDQEKPPTHQQPRQLQRPPASPGL